MHAIHGACLVGFGEALQLLFGLFDRAEIEQLAQIGVAHQLAELILIDGEWPALGARPAGASPS